MEDVLGWIGLGVFLIAIIVIPLTVWRVFRSSAQVFSQVDTVFARSDAARKRAEEKERESVILQLAAQHEGTVTAFQVSQHTDMTLSEAAGYLEGMVRAGAAEMEVRDSGAIVYRFVLA